MNSGKVLPFQKKENIARTELTASEVLTTLKIQREYAREIRDNLCALQQEGAQNIHQIREIFSSIYAFQTDKEPAVQERVQDYFPRDAGRLQHFHRQADEIQEAIEDFKNERKKLKREIRAKGKEIKQYNKVTMEQAHRLRHALGLLEQSKEKERVLIRSLETKKQKNKRLAHRLRTKNQQLQRLARENDQLNLGSEPEKNSQNQNRAAGMSPVTKQIEQVIQSTQYEDDLNQVKGGWFGMFGLSWGSKEKEAAYLQKTEELTLAIAGLQKEMQEYKQLFEEMIDYIQKQELTGTADKEQTKLKAAIQGVKEQQDRRSENLTHKDQFESKKNKQVKKRSNNQAAFPSGESRKNDPGQITNNEKKFDPDRYSR